MTQVALAWIPIFFSIEPTFTLFLSFKLPSLLGINFGTIKRERPFTPFGPPGIFAKTKWIMFSVRSCSPAEIKIF